MIEKAIIDSFIACSITSYHMLVVILSLHNKILLL